MYELFSFLCIAALLCFILGLIKPNLMIFWSKSKTRKAAFIYLIPWFIFGIGVGAFAPKPITPVNTASTSNEQHIKSSTSANKQVDSSPPKTKKASSSNNTMYSVGQTAKADGVELTVQKVKISQGDGYTSPKNGYEFVVVTVKIKNVGTVKMPYGRTDFRMQNSQGQITDVSNYVETSTALGAGDLIPGGSVSGTIFFEEPKNDNNLVLRYDESLFAQTPKMQFKLS